MGNRFTARRFRPRRHHLAIAAIFILFVIGITVGSPRLAVLALIGALVIAPI